MCLQPGKLKAVLRIGETQARDLAIGQPALIDTRNGMVRGHVSRMDPAAQGGTVAIDVAIDGALPPGARRDVNVDGTIQLQRLNNIVFTGRPTIAQDHALIGMFMGASRLVDGTARGGGRETPVAERRSDVRILDIFQNTASVRVDAGGWIDYMHVVKWKGRWMILNVLWENRRRP